MALALFDFDGTISHQDSGVAFLLYSQGGLKLLMGALRFWPDYALYASHLAAADRFKTKVLTYFFRDWPLERFIGMASRFAQERLPNIVRQTAVDRINWHKQRGDTIAVVSPSVEWWLKPWCEAQGIPLIATRLEVRDGKLTGQLQGANCKGQEKVVRIRQHYNLHQFDEIYAYGDSSGDREMLAIATHKFYRYFAGK